LIPVVMGVAAALAVVVIVGLFASGRGSRRTSGRKSVQPPGAGGAHVAPAGPDPRAAAVIRDAERALAEARRRADAIVQEAEAKSAEIAADAEAAREAVLAEARRSAHAVVKQAENEARELVASAELRCARAEEAMLRDYELAAERRQELSRLVRGLLDEVEARLGSANASSHVPDSREATHAAPAADE
jgi:cell division septum initiation protein DivIVA